MGQCLKKTALTLCCAPCHAPRGKDWVDLKMIPKTELMKIPKSERDARIIWCRVVNVYDGDTFTVARREGDGQIRTIRVRLGGIDCPEMKPPLSQPRRDIEIAAAVEARDRLREILPVGKIIPLQVNGLDKYGRLLGSCRCKKGKLDVAQVLIREGHGYAYDGGTKKSFAKSKKSRKENSDSKKQRHQKKTRRKRSGSVAKEDKGRVLRKQSKSKRKEETKKRSSSSRTMSVTPRKECNNKNKPVAKTTTKINPVVGTSRTTAIRNKLFTQLLETTADKRNTPGKRKSPPPPVPRRKTDKRDRDEWSSTDDNYSSDEYSSLSS